MNTRLIFGTFNTLPLGLTDDEIETRYQSHYKPFVQQLYTNPDLQAVIYYCGTLLEWVEEHHSELLKVLSEMVSRRQIELIGGAYYEPVLPLIPRQDRVGQIELMTTMLRKQFGRRPRGCWIPQCVWEPGLTTSLSSSGMEYTFLEDTQFLRAGVAPGDFLQPAVTEDQGKLLTVFPLYSGIGKKHGSGFLPSLKSNGKEPVLLVRILPGEQFRTDYIQEILKVRNAGQLRTVLPGKYLRSQPARQKVYFSSSSPAAVHRWALGIEAQKEHARAERMLVANEMTDIFLEGGLFRNFLIRYPEAGRLYAKMQYTHILVNQIRGDKHRKQAAREDLWRGQHHSGYWHGDTPGLYHLPTRRELYRSLIAAESMGRESGIFKPSLVSIDFDMDGRDEFLYQGSVFNAYLHSVGATMFELDSFKVQQNLLMAMARHPEAYHNKTHASGGYDRYGRSAFLDFFLQQGSDHSKFADGQGKDEVGLQDAIFAVKEVNREQYCIAMEYECQLDSAAASSSVIINKKFKFEKNGVRVCYRLENSGSLKVEKDLGVQINLALVASDDVGVRARGIAGGQLDLEQKHSFATSKIQIDYKKKKENLAIITPQPVTVCIDPIITHVVQDGISIEPMQQGIAILYRLPISLQPGETFSSSFDLQFA
ncbi:MAG: DUF1926 domain-containing protein [Spirochaetaceae bacterium]|nr:MAG: DUF1926 domain-containing protein [Spirochaetaceae bacterium]